MNDCDRWAGRYGQSGPVGQPYYPAHYAEAQRIEQRIRNQHQTTQS